MLFQLNPTMQLMDNAPSLQITERYSAFPQHYYTYNQNLQSVSQILANIEVSDDILLFASKDSAGMYIQVGLIGVESYPLLRHESITKKIVYGRKWRIDSDLPTPEIVQTAYLAVQKAKEHEVRELLTYQPLGKKSFASPFSCHQDSELLRAVVSTHASVTPPQTLDEHNIVDTLKRLRFASRPFLVKHFIELPEKRFLVDLNLDLTVAEQEPIPEEFKQATFSLLIAANEPYSLFYRLIDSCIQISNRHVAETFRYKHFERFSEALSPDAIGHVSLASRPYTKQFENKEFTEIFQQENAKTDTARVPHIGVAPLRDINIEKLQKQHVLHGFLPDGLLCEHADVSNR